MENGNLLVSLRTGSPIKGLQAGAGRLVELDPQGKIVWEHKDLMQHHDLSQTPNGNVVYLAWELTPSKEAERIQGGVPGSEHENGGV